MTILRGDELECPDQPRPGAAVHRPRPGVRLRDIAAGPGSTERSAYGIVTVHGSSSPESGARQIKIFFSELVYRSAPAGE